MNCSVTYDDLKSLSIWCLSKPPMRLSVVCFKICRTSSTSFKILEWRMTTGLISDDHWLDIRWLRLHMKIKMNKILTCRITVIDTYDVDLKRTNWLFTLIIWQGTIEFCLKQCFKVDWSIWSWWDLIENCNFNVIIRHIIVNLFQYKIHAHFPTLREFFFLKNNKNTLHALPFRSIR